jgi:DUF1009 family protein
METIGLIAGSGDFPLVFAREARRSGVKVVAIALSGITDESLANSVDSLYTFRLGQLSEPLKVFKSAGIRRAVMAGKVQHASLFGGVLPDLRAAKLLAKLKDKRADTILCALAEEFSREGIELLSSATYLSHLMASVGPLSARRPTTQEARDMELGWRAAKALAGFDIGQSVVVSHGAVIAVEAMEGTDATIFRAADLAKSQGKSPSLVLVKVAKPQQDFRFDLPVLGLKTLKTFELTGISAVALEAHKTLLLDKEHFLKKADELKLAVIAKT